MDALDTDLRYIDAGHVDTPGGRLDAAVLVSPTHASLGKLDGIVIDPTARQVRYYVCWTKSNRTRSLAFQTTIF